ncbi:MAG TPA: hypothetical protein VHQ86_01510, partial [Candidatus Saccharimonadia bacterium]|nr:hypothetical protein [Candidatus Saccharimonadia bacterium]
MKRVVIGLAYMALMVAEAVWSYVSPSYRFHESPLIMGLGLVGAIVTLIWWRRRPGRWDWLLAGGLVVAALAAFPSTSRDHVRYLFDGEMIRLLHASPYTHLPYEFPVD